MYLYWCPLRCAWREASGPEISQSVLWAWVFGIEFKYAYIEP